MAGEINIHVRSVSFKIFILTALQAVSGRWFHSRLVMEQKGVFAPCGIKTRFF